MNTRLDKKTEKGCGAGATSPLLPEHRADYVNGVLRLGLFYAWHGATGGKPLREVLSREANVYRLTSLWEGGSLSFRSGCLTDNPLWLRTLDEIESVYLRHVSDAVAFEEEAFKALWPLAEPAVARDVANWPWIPEGYSTTRFPEQRVVGCFAWEPLDESGDVAIHIANACMPDSPFRNITDRAGELLEMIARIRDVEPCARRILCNSWLNAFPPFLSLFPAHWPEKENNAAISPGCNWWGQFMSRDGRFHHEHGRIMRETLRFPFPSIDGAATPGEIEEHLSQKKA